MNPAPMPYVTALYAGLCGLLVVALGFRVTLLRRALKVGIGDGGDPRLARAVRVHANAVEWGLLALLLLLVAEENRAAPGLLHACGIALIVGRVLHAVGLGGSSGPSLGRTIGTVLTLAAVIALAWWNILTFVRVAAVM
jgi:uncharacterized protein